MLSTQEHECKLYEDPGPLQLLDSALQRYQRRHTADLTMRKDLDDLGELAHDSCHRDETMSITEKSEDSPKVAARNSTMRIADEITTFRTTPARCQSSDRASTNFLHLPIELRELIYAADIFQHGDIRVQLCHDGAASVATVYQNPLSRTNSGVSAEYRKCMTMLLQKNRASCSIDVVRLAWMLKGKPLHALLPLQHLRSITLSFSEFPWLVTSHLRCLVCNLHRDPINLTPLLHHMKGLETLSIVLPGITNDVHVALPAIHSVYGLMYRDNKTLLPKLRHLSVRCRTKRLHEFMDVLDVPLPLSQGLSPHYLMSQETNIL